MLISEIDHVTFFFVHSSSSYFPVQTMRLLLSVLIGSAVSAKLTINPMKHSVTPITRPDFDAVVSKFRDRQVSVIYYYKAADSESVKFFEPFNTVATDLRGMFKFGAVNCDEEAKLCKDEGVALSDTFPVIKVYPMVPLSPEFVPGTDYEKLTDEKGGFKKTIYKLLSSEHASKIASETVEQFLAPEDHLPVVILMSTKKSVPPLYKAISTQFSKEMHFGFLPSPSSDILKKFKVKSESALPKIVLQQAGKSPLVYDGELTYTAIHDWINVRRETFARGGGFDHTAREGASPSGSAKPPSRPWLTEDVPEMFSKSHKDICFKHDEGLCLIYLVNGEIDESSLSMLKDLKSAVADESIRFRFSWMNIATETGFKDMIQPESLPNVVVFNPHKRLRYAGPIEDTVDRSSIRSLIDSIIGGNGRFKMVPGKVLPDFVERKREEKDEL
jgi:hypothetical protein